jgi:hypothetical protein
MRAYTPVDTTLPKRISPSRFVPEGKQTIVMQLEGEGLRPNEDRDKAALEASALEQEAAPATNNLPALLQGLMEGTGMGVAPGANVPYVPFPIPAPNQDAP